MHEIMGHIGATTGEICGKVRGKNLTLTSLDRLEQVLVTVLGDSVRRDMLQNKGHEHLCTGRKRSMR